MKYGYLMVQFFYLVILFSTNNVNASDDRIVEFSVQESIGFEDVPLVQIEVNVSKTRDLHVAIQNMDGWKTVKRTMNRLKVSGKYHFEMPVENLAPGKYRVDAYLTPKGKNWSERLGETSHTVMTVLDVEKLVKKTHFSDKDNVKFVDFPKEVLGKEEVSLKVVFNITAPRDLHIKLLNSDNWKEFGALKFPVTTPADMILPLSNMTDDFPPANYAWVIYLTESGKKEPIVKKFGKHFILKAAE